MGRPCVLIAGCFALAALAPGHVAEAACTTESSQHVEAEASSGSQVWVVLL